MISQYQYRRVLLATVHDKLANDTNLVEKVTI